MSTNSSKEKDKVVGITGNANDRITQYTKSVKQRIVELEIGLRVQDKQITNNYKLKKLESKKKGRKDKND